MPDHPSHSLAAIEGRIKAATPGPWESHPGGDVITRDTGALNLPWLTIVSSCCGEDHEKNAGVQREADADLIAAAPTDLALLVEVAKAAMLTRKRSIALDAALAPLRDEEPA